MIVWAKQRQHHITQIAHAMQAARAISINADALGSR
jgi:hypothetical protein